MVQVTNRNHNEGSRTFVITEKAPTMAFSWLKVPSRAFILKTLDILKLSGGPYTYDLCFGVSISSLLTVFRCLFSIGGFN